MAGSVAYTCSKIYPYCAYVLTAGLDATNFPLILTHIDQNHKHEHPYAPFQTINDALTYS